MEFVSAGRRTTEDNREVLRLIGVRHGALECVPYWDALRTVAMIFNWEDKALEHPLGEESYLYRCFQ